MPRKTLSCGSFSITKPSTYETIAYFIGLALVYVYRWILDDAFVYSRYIDNLLLGNGLVYNKGEYVEGFTSPLWCLLLATLRTLGLSYTAIIVACAVILYTVFWYLMVVVNRSLSPRDSVAVNAPLVLAVTNFAITSWFTSGMETPLAMVFAVLFALFALKPDSRLLHAAIGMSFLVRHEYALPMVIAALWTWKRSRRHLLSLVCTWIAIVGPWMLFRIYYYADFFPNTFYLKDSTNFMPGLIYLYDGLHAYHILPVSIVLIGVLYLCRNKNANNRLHMAERGVMLSMAAIMTLYTIRVGGDTWHFRQLLFPYTLVLCSFSGAAEMGLRLIEPVRRRYACVVVSLLIGLVSLDSYPNQLATHPLWIKWEWHWRGSSDDTSYITRDDPFPHHFVKGVECPPFGSCRDLFHETATARDPLLEQPSRSATPEAPYIDVISEGWCATAWASMDCYIVQRYGLTNPILARSDIPSDLPGHKRGLFPLSVDIRDIISRNGAVWTAGMFERAMSERQAKEWISGNIDAITLLERKALNRHKFGENLLLALRPVPVIHVYLK
jgi:hypothetical protein